jgi:taurine---2-oxoglutarate transaminase
MESVFRTKLEGLKAKHPSVGDVRGKGMFWGVELVKNRATKEPFGTFKDKAARKPLVVDQVVAKCMEQGVSLVGWISHLVLAPPLILTEGQLDECIAALDTALAITDALVEA